MRVISVINQKGGVGKTTSVINVGASLAFMKKKVLLVDLDPQGNLSAGLNIGNEVISEKNAYSALVGKGSLADNIVKSSVEGLDVVPSDSNLAGAEIELVSVLGREFRLKESITDEIHQYDYIFIDCPPSLGLLTLNALCASQGYLIPMQCEFFSLQGLTSILKTAQIVKKHLNPSLELEGILLTMFDSRSNLSKQVFKELKDYVGDKLFQSVVPRRIRLAESTSHGVPGVVYDPSCLGSRSYINVAREIVSRVEGKEYDAPKQTFMPPDPVDRLGGKIEKGHSSSSVGAAKAPLRESALN